MQGSSSPDITRFANGVCSPGQLYRYKGKPGEATRIRVSMAGKGAFAACWVFGMMRSTAAERRAVLMEYGPGDAEKYRRRLRSQRHSQRSYRDMQADEGIPERDDVAKVALASLLERCAQMPEAVESFVKEMSGRLAKQKQRFDPDRSAETIRNMIARQMKAAEQEARRRAADRRRET